VPPQIGGAALGPPRYVVEDHRAIVGEPVPQGGEGWNPDQHVGRVGRRRAVDDEQLDPVAARLTHRSRLVPAGWRAERRLGRYRQLGGAELRQRDVDDPRGVEPLPPKQPADLRGPCPVVLDADDSRPELARRAGEHHGRGTAAQLYHLAPSAAHLVDQQRDGGRPHRPVGPGQLRPVEDRQRPRHGEVVGRPAGR
jgi:hypothetical protein